MPALSLPSVGALLLSLAVLLHPAAADNGYVTSSSQTPRDNNPNCSCYAVPTGKDSKTPSYFQFYRFYDFRNLDGLDTAPPLCNSSTTVNHQPSWQPNLFESDAWTSDWGIQNWTKAASNDFPVPMNHSKANVYIGREKDVSYLSLRTSRMDKYQTSAEIENHQKNLMHVSMRMYARVKGSTGAVAGFFTFFDDSNESDIEILTNDPTDKIRYTNQPSVDKHGNEVAQASVGPNNLPHWDEWQLHRIDWLPKNSYWYINNVQVAANTYSVPRKPSFLMLNMWSDGGEWSGNMTVGKFAEMQIQWIDMTFNTSGPYEGAKADNKKVKRDDPGAWLSSKRDDQSAHWSSKRAAKGCQTVCKINNVAQMGTPEVLPSSAVTDKGVSRALLFFAGLVYIFALY